VAVVAINTGDPVGLVGGLALVALNWRPRRTAGLPVELHALSLDDVFELFCVPYLLLYLIDTSKNRTYVVRDHNGYSYSPVIPTGYLPSVP
jgi:hypothetical protein